MAETVNQSSEGSVARISVLEERVRALTQLVDERDRLYMEKFKASETAVGAAIIASDKQTAQNFAASEKAISKAEEAQREYNIRSNEFRGQLDDQAKRLMPREEAQINFKAQDQKLESVKENFSKEIASLRESRSEGGGAARASASGQQSTHWLIGVVIGLVLGLAGLIAGYLRH
jgi:hypothetical protein